MTKHRGTFEFCSGWDAGVKAQNKKIQEIVDHIEEEYDTNNFSTPDYYAGLIFCLEDLKDLSKGDSDE